jgi:hypothetical protein
MAKAVLVLALLLGACSSNKAPEPLEVPLGKPFALPFGQSAIITGTPLRLTFREPPGDSRCPTTASVKCVWAGSATVRLEVTSGATSSTVSLETNAVRDEARREALALGYRLELLGLEPEERTEKAPDTSQYVAFLRVRPAE